MSEQSNPDPSGGEFHVTPKPEEAPQQNLVADQKVRSETGFYLNYWKDRDAEWRDDDPERALIARKNYARLNSLTLGVVRTGELSPDADGNETVLSQLREWVQILGPENPLGKAELHLELVANRILEHIDEANPEKPGERESALLDAASCLMAAARLHEEPAKSSHIREAAREILFDLRQGVNPDADTEKKKCGGDAAMLLHEIDYDELYEAYFNGEVDETDFQIAYVRIHMQHVKEFLNLFGARDSDHNLPSGVAFEWWHTLMYRHSRILNESAHSLAHNRLRTSLTFEDAPIGARGAPKDKLSDGRDAVIENYDEEGNPTIAARIQIKSHANDRTRYRKPIIVLRVEDDELQDNRQLLAYMRTTTRGMVAELRGQRDQSPQDAMEHAYQIVDYHNYPESQLVTAR